MNLPPSAMLRRMGKWILQEGARLETGDDGQARLTQTYLADRKQGIVEAAQRGFAYGTTMVLQGRYFFLAHINPRFTAHGDEVDLVWIGPAGAPPPRRPLHLAGDEEWSLEGSMETWDGLPGTFYNANNQQKNPPANKIVRIPKTVLVWRKWIRPPWSVGGNVAPRALPRNMSDATAMLSTYSMGGGSLEAGGPRIGCTLGGAVGEFLLCVDISVEADGNLILRTAKFEYSYHKWDSDLYPPSSGGDSLSKPNGSPEKKALVARARK